MDEKTQDGFFWPNPWPGLAWLTDPSAFAYGSVDKPLYLPRVSVIIINFNYGRFLRAAVESVLSQTYPNVECIIVDNASTDESPEVLAAIEARVPAVKVIRRGENGGQTAAALDGLAASSGAYVIFQDADDFLLPDCTAIHVYVHLSSRIHVGFTSGDMQQLSGDQLVLGTEHAFNRRMLTRRGLKPRAFRPYRHSFGAEWPPADFDRGVLQSVRFVGLTSEWVWAPTSANCFRRDALDLFADHPDLLKLRTGTDLYFCLGVNAVSSSALIDVPVAVYRLHGGNIYSQRPQLNHVLCYQPGGSGDSNEQARMVLADHLVQNADRFVERGWPWIAYIWLLFLMDRKNTEKNARGWARWSRVSLALVKSYDRVVPLLGAFTIKLWLALHLVPPSVILSLGKNPDPPQNSIDPN